MTTYRYILRRSSHLSISLSLAVLCAVFLPGHWDVSSRALIGWNIGVWSYLLVLAYSLLRSSNHACAKTAQVKRMARQEDKGAGVILVLLAMSASLSLIAILFELAGIRGLPVELRILKYLLTVATILGSWLLVMVVFGFHYAHLYYQTQDAQTLLRFPEDNAQPDLWDFMYFSATISVAAQTSDVSVTSPRIRKIVLAQSLLSFFFNASIVGLSVNIAASLV